VYFSPQQMIGYSQNRPSPKYNSFKADVFALGVMLVEIIFGEDLEYIYDYQNFEIKLNPLLEKLQGIKR
jgi:serine/threonine protein kinase